MINLTAVFNFFIILIELCVIGAMIFTAMDFIGTDERFKKIAKIAVGGVLVVLFLFAVRDVFGGGGSGGMNLTPGGFLVFAVAVILTLILWYVIDALLGWVAANWAPFLCPRAYHHPLCSRRPDACRHSVSCGEYPVGGVP